MAQNPPYLRKLAKRGDISVWIVDGSYIRGHMDEEFTNFGQHHRFHYIPDNEFWLDAEAAQNEYAFYIDHLLVERRLMAHGKSYGEAIVVVERKERRRAGDVAQATHHGRSLD